MTTLKKNCLLWNFKVSLGFDDVIVIMGTKTLVPALLPSIGVVYQLGEMEDFLQKWRIGEVEK